MIDQAYIGRRAGLAAIIAHEKRICIYTIEEFTGRRYRTCL
jgi:hypothetical protein